MCVLQESARADERGQGPCAVRCVPRCPAGVVLSYGMLESLMEDPSHIYS